VAQGSSRNARGIATEGKRKGRSYGTIVVDLEQHRVVDLLPDRTAATLTGWLQQRPGVEVVARDRSTEYASAIALGAPAAVQVTDRWHLLANMRQAVERWLAGAHGRLRRLPAISDDVGALCRPDAPGRSRVVPWTNRFARTAVSVVLLCMARCSAGVPQANR